MHLKHLSVLDMKQQYILRLISIHIRVSRFSVQVLCHEYPVKNINFVCIHTYSDYQNIVGWQGFTMMLIKTSLANTSQSCFHVLLGQPQAEHPLSILQDEKSSTCKTDGDKFWLYSEVFLKNNLLFHDHVKPIVKFKDSEAY